MRRPASPDPPGNVEFTAVGLLTRRERQVASLVALGHTNAEVANLLQIHEKTVETHRNHIMTKLGLRTRADLVRFALAQGLVNSGPPGRFFHCCPGCSFLWSGRDQFLSDREVTFLGYQPTDTADAPGTFGFQHWRCGTKMSIELESLIELAGEPLLAASCAQHRARVRYCLAKQADTPCPPKCVCAFVWRTSQIAGYWGKA